MDLFKFQCPHCEERYTCSDDMRGCRLICRLCEEEILIPEVGDQDADTTEWEFAQKECKICGGSLDVLGECETCKKKAEELRKGKKKPSVKKSGSGKLFNKAMKARMPGMAGIHPEEKQTSKKPSGPRRRRRRR
jgi:hypothetical protein